MYREITGSQEKDYFKMRMAKNNECIINWRSQQGHGYHDRQTKQKQSPDLSVDRAEGKG